MYNFGLPKSSRRASEMDLIFVVWRPVRLKNGHSSPKTVFHDFLGKYYLFQKNSPVKKYSATNSRCKMFIYFSLKMSPRPKKWSYPAKNGFSRFSGRMTAFLNGVATPAKILLFRSVFCATDFSFSRSPWGAENLNCAACEWVCKIFQPDVRERNFRSARPNLIFKLRKSLNNSRLNRFVRQLFLHENVIIFLNSSKQNFANHGLARHARMPAERCPASVNESAIMTSKLQLHIRQHLVRTVNPKIEWIFGWAWHRSVVQSCMTESGWLITGD